MMQIGRILMQKLARDRVRQLSKVKSMDLIPAPQKREAELCMKLVTAGKDGWDVNFRTVYALSEAVQNRVVYEWTAKSLCEARSHL